MWMRRSAMLQFQYSLTRDFKEKLLPYQVFAFGLDTYIAFFICTSKFLVALLFILFAFLITFIH